MRPEKMYRKSRCYGTVLKDILCFINSNFHGRREDTEKHNNEVMMLTGSLMAFVIYF